MITFVGDYYSNGSDKLEIDMSSTIFNLEAPITCSNNPMPNKVVLKMCPTSFKKRFQSNKPLAVNLANNHIFDYGEDGVTDTLAVLDELEIPYFGIIKQPHDNGMLEISHQGATYTLQGMVNKSCSPLFVAGSFRLKEFKSNMNSILAPEIKSNKINILCVHQGREEISIPSVGEIQSMRKLLYRDIFDYVICSHQHVILPYEKKCKKWIFYGLGNFIFDNLEVGSYFRGRVPTKTYIKKQMPKNKESLVVTIGQRVHPKIKLYQNGYFNLSILRIVIMHLKIVLAAYPLFNKIMTTSIFINVILKDIISNPRIPRLQTIYYYLNKLRFKEKNKD